jgi:hypothetical protein
MRSVILYLVLVGIPLLGLLGLLEAGERIVPPRSVGGAWELVPTPAHEGLPACLALGSRSAPGHLSVSQSGTQAELIVGARPPIRISAEVRGDSLIGRARYEGVSTCPAAVVRIRAELRESEGTEFLHGIVIRENCAPCSPTPFVARRLADAEAP